MTKDEACCIYCNQWIEAPELPFDCPSCGRDLRVISVGGDKAGLVAQCDRGWLDDLIRATGDEGLTLDMRNWA